MDISAAETTTILRQTWCDVLGVDDVQADDNFFTLGGESLSAMTVVGRISARLGVEINLEGLYENSTFAEFTMHVVSTLPDNGNSGRSA